MGYKPHLIASFKTAKFIGMEPWLSPQDAFSTLENMVVNKGVLEKRLGYSLFAQMKHGTTPQTTTSITGIKTYLQNGMPQLLVMDSKGSAGSFTGRCNRYDSVNDTMIDISSDLSTPADIFSGSPSDFFHSVNWRGVIYIVNNVDQIYQWAGLGNAVVPFNIRIESGDPKANQVDTCRFMFIIDDRLVLLAPTELGTYYPQRLRFGAVLQTDFTIAGGGKDDAETQQTISAAGMIGKTVYAFFDGPDGGSLWRIRRTGNTSIPLEWERVTSQDGSRSPYSGIEWNEGLVAIGLSNILFTDGSPVQPIKNLDLPAIRDILTEFNDSKIRSVFGYQHRERDKRHLLFTFADSSSSSMDRILDYNTMENNWTVHKSAQSFFLNCMGGFNGQVVPTGQELDDVVGTDGDLISSITVDSREIFGNPSPFTLIGGRNSRIYKWNDGEFDGTDDSNGNITIQALSGRWNPFTKDGRKVSCEKIGFLVDNDANASFTAAMFKNSGSVSYKSKVISCDSDDDTVDKFWVYIFCNGETGDFHRLKISHTERDNTPKIHAIKPYFQSAGRLDS